MKLQYCLTGILCFFLNANAKQIKPLTVGDKVPAVAINILNYPALQSNLSAFKNKLVILDFFATNCSSCLKALPAFEALQKKYNGRIQLITVTYEKKDKIIKFLLNHPQIKLPVIAEDKTLSKMFPHTFIPHEVWIQNGIVKAITGQQYVKEENILALLNNEKIKWPVKNEMAGFDYTQPLLHTNHDNIPAESRPSKVFYSMVAGNIPGITPNSTITFDSVKGTVTTAFINMPVTDLYKHAMNKLRLPNSHIILQVKNNNRYVYDKTAYKAEWKLQNTWCFESVLPSAFPMEVRRQKMLSGLDIFFGLHAAIEKRQTACMVLIPIPFVITASAASPLDSNKSTVIISPAGLVYTLNSRTYGTPFFDSSGITQKLVLGIDEKHLTDIDQLQQALKKYGLQFIIRQKEMDMLVIKEQEL